MSPRKTLTAISLSLLLAFVIVQPAFGSPAPIGPSANLTVSLSFSPNPVSVNMQTTGSYSIGGGVGPYTIWENNTPMGCNPPTNPFSTPNPSGTFQCTPTSTGSFLIQVTVHDSAGNQGSTSTTLTVTSQGGGGSGGNNTGGFNLSGLTDLLGVLMIIGVVFLASVVAIAASAVALAILVPRRLKQIRMALEGQPMKKHEPKVPSPQAEPPKEAPPNDEL